MKRLLSLILVLSLCMSIMPSYAATSKVDANALKVLNTVNFSSKSNDTTAVVKKWLKLCKDQTDDNALIVMSNGRESFIDKSVPYTVYSERKVVQEWALKGKVDKSLGQCYTSKVNLTVWASRIVYGVVTTDAWIKKSGGKYTITKVTYNYDERKPSQAELNFEPLKNKQIYANSHAYFNGFYNLVRELVDLEDSGISSYEVFDNGMSVAVSPEDSFIFSENLLCKIDPSEYDLSEGYVFAEIEVESSLKVNPDFAIIGLQNYEDDYSNNFDLLDKETGESAITEDGTYDLEPGITYQAALFLGDDMPIKEKSVIVICNLNEEKVQ